MADQCRLQEQLNPRAKTSAEVLVVETDDSMLPIRGEESWKEAKVGVVYRHDVRDRRWHPVAHATSLSSVVRVS